MAAGEGPELPARHRCVKRDAASMAIQREQQRGDVGVPQDRPGLAPAALVVDPIEDAGDSVAAPNAPDRMNGGIGQGPVEVGQPSVVGSGEPGVVQRSAPSQHRLPSESAAQCLGAVQVIALEEWSGGRYQRYPASGGDPGWANNHL